MTRKGFTMIELLMVIMITSILGAVALPQFLDFRNEARAAAVHQILSTMRVGMKNQIQQARLRCGATDTILTTHLPAALSQNDITYNNNICTAAQVPNAAERRFWDPIPESSRSHSWFSGNPLPPTSYYQKNPLSVNQASQFIFSHIVVVTLESTILSAGGRCAYLSVVPVPSDWIFIQSSQDFYAASNTPGISECNF